ncbi:hypothetical protein CYU11_11925 [Vibrio parahaemolyticus]|nr:hypothetical protein CYU11_11925 [Vibrio parahaemolyticus]
MEYIAIAVLLVFLTFALQVFSFRRKSINCSIDALKKTINTLPVESTPSGRVMKSKLAKQYYFISHRVKSNDIRDYAKRIFGIKSPPTRAYCDAFINGFTQRISSRAPDNEFSTI